MLDKARWTNRCSLNPLYFPVFQLQDTEISVVFFDNHQTRIKFALPQAAVLQLFLLTFFLFRDDFGKKN